MNRIRLRTSLFALLAVGTAVALAAGTGTLPDSPRAPRPPLDPAGEDAHGPGPLREPPPVPAPAPAAAPSAGPAATASEPDAGPGAADRAARVAELLRRLDDDVPRRDRIVREIAGIGGPSAWAGLAGRLGEPALRRSIEEALGTLAPAEVARGLARRLAAATDPGERASIARILGRTADPAHAETVRTLLAGEVDPRVRHAAIRALGRFGDAGSADALLALVRRDAGDRGAALFALQEIQSEETLRRLAGGWSDLPADARRSLLRAALAVEVPSGPVLDLARKGLAEEDERSRVAAIGILSRAGDDAVAALVDHALRGEETERALRALAEVGTAKAAEGGLRAVEALPAPRQEAWRAEFRRLLGR